MKGRFFKKLGRFTSYVLLCAILATLPINSSILCIESDGTSSIESASLGSCLAANISAHDKSTSITDGQASDDHDDCFDCTDISLSQDKSAKLQNDYNYSTISDTFLIGSTSFEVPVFTEPIVSFTPNLEFVPNQLHKHLQTIIFLI